MAGAQLLPERIRNGSYRIWCKERIMEVYLNSIEMGMARVWRSSSNRTLV
jgi:hypothetical protein